MYTTNGKIILNFFNIIKKEYIDRLLLFLPEYLFYQLLRNNYISYKLKKKVNKTDYKYLLTSVELHLKNVYYIVYLCIIINTDNRHIVIRIQIPYCVWTIIYLSL